MELQAWAAVGILGFHVLVTMPLLIIQLRKLRRRLDVSIERWDAGIARIDAH